MSRKINASFKEKVKGKSIGSKGRILFSFVDIRNEVAVLLVENEDGRNPEEYVRRKSDFLNRTPELVGSG